jgi:hypothetical protein
MDGKGNSFSNGPHYGGSDMPKLARSRAVADAQAMTVTFWDLI